ncbi:MAG TPA: hypothetical protein VEB39_02285 [Sphingomicrobium sp.]|nr:hypothetical protein [Sphingomicrobium sp.]
MPNADRRTMLKLSVAGAGTMIAAPSLGASAGAVTAADFDHLTVRHRKVRVDGIDIFYRGSG